MNYFPCSHQFEKGLRILLLLAVLLLSLGPAGTITAFAAAPTYDDFTFARVINSIEFHDWGPDNTGLDTTEALPSDTDLDTDGDPDHFTCENREFRFGYASIWYQYTAPETQSIGLDTIGTEYDTFIAVWTGTKGNLTPVPGACNDENYDGYAETSFIANPGITYYIEVAQYNDGQFTTHNIGGKLFFNAYITNTDVTIGGILRGRYYVPESGSVRKGFIKLNSGPVKIENRANNQIIAAERVIYKFNNVPLSFSEMMGLPNNQLSTTYWLPWYNNVDLDTQLRIGNVSASTAHVNVYIAGALKTPTPLTLAPGASVRQSFTGVNNGPVQIVSDVNIVAAERVIYRINGLPVSFSEMMGLPASQLRSSYFFPWYNNVDLDTQLRIGNVSNTPATVQIFIGGVQMQGSPFVLAVGASARKSFTGINKGPVKIISNVPIVAAERVIYRVDGAPTSFSELMGLPNTQLSHTYWMPWYNNVGLDTQLRFANAGISPATVHVFIGGQEMQGSPFTLPVNGSTRMSFPGINGGPVRIESNVNIVAAERVIYKVSGKPTSFTEMMGLPNAFLDVAYWMPWYNSVDLDTQLRFGMP